MLMVASLAALPASAATSATPPVPVVTPTAYKPLQNTGWTRKDGAPADVFSMTQDSAGLLWFAAKDGLYRFDGVRFLRKREVYGHPLHAPATNVVVAVGDAIWVGYQFGGISRFVRGGVTHYIGKDDPQGSVSDLFPLPDGSFWALTARGIYYLDGNTWHLVTPADGLPEGYISNSTAMPDGSMLVYAPDGIYRSARKAGRMAYSFTKILDRPNVNGGEIMKDGRILINSGAYDMALFDVASGAVTPFVLDNGGLPMNMYHVDTGGRLWVSTGDILQLIDDARRPVQVFMPANGLSGRTMTSSLTDREGNHWIATENGIDRLREPRLATIALPAGQTGLLGVAAGDDGAVWVINFHHPDAFKVPTFVVDRAGNHYNAGIDRVSATHRQADGTLWFAGSGGLWRVHGHTTTRVAPPPGLRGETVQAITVTPDGVIWISVVAHGVYALRDGVWQPGGGHPELAKPTAISLTTDRVGRLWIGYVNNRIGMLDHGVVRYFGDKDGLNVGNVLTMTQGRDRIWIGGDRGLAWFDGQRFSGLAERGRGAYSGLSGIVERPGGELWLHDTSGLARIDASALAVAMRDRLPDVAAERFDYLDGHQGMPAQVRPLPSLIQATDGRLWYATSSSVGYIDPAAIARNPRPPTVLIDAVVTDAKRYAADTTLVLPPRTARLEFQFTATALSMPERVRFRYRLVGQDSTWRDGDATRQAVYTNLEPGAYRFEVVAANEDGVWSTRPATVSLHIAPAFTQTLGFKLACAFVVLAAAWLLYRWRMAVMAKRLHNDLKVRVLERERIARTLHDTFLQSVQALMLRMQMLMQKLPSESSVRDEVGDVLARAADVIGEGRDRVRQLRVPAVRKGSLAQALAAAGQELAASTAIHFTIRDNASRLRLDPDVEDELFTLGREALANAFRHAGAAHIALELDYHAGTLRLAIIDDGRGIPPDILARGAREGHWGMQGMRECARLAGGVLAVTSTPAGTTVSTTISVTAAARSGVVQQAG